MKGDKGERGKVKVTVVLTKGGAEEETYDRKDIREGTEVEGEIKSSLKAISAGPETFDNEPSLHNTSVLSLGEDPVIVEGDMRVIKPFVPTLYMQADVVHLSKVDLQHTDGIGRRGFFQSLKVRVGCGMAVGSGGEMEVRMSEERRTAWSEAVDSKSNIPRTHIATPLLAIAGRPRGG